MAKVKIPNMQHVTINYNQLRQLRTNQMLSQSVPFPNTRKLSLPQTSHSIQPQVITSHLLRTALQHTRKKSQQLFLLTQQQSKSISNHSQSQQLNTLQKPKKQKIKNNHKNHSMASQLFQIKSQDEDKEAEEIRLMDNILGQSQAVYKYVFGHQRQLPSQLINTWKECLSHQDKMEIYGNNATYSYGRIFPINYLQQNFNKIYGRGRQRHLYAGQQSIIIEQLRKYFQKCTDHPQKFARKAYDIIVNDILPNTKLSELEDLPLCIRQIQSHLVIMATKWRYSGRLNLKDKLMESCLVTGKSNIIDLKKSNALTKFILERCQANK